MFVRYLGCGIGHLELRARGVEGILLEGFNAEAQLLPDTDPGEPSLDHGHEHIADEDEQESNDEHGLVDPAELFAEL